MKQMNCNKNHKFEKDWSIIMACEECWEVKLQPEFKKHLHNKNDKERK